METESASGAEATDELGAQAPADSSSFWKSVPGILTACTGLVVAISGLLSGLGQAGIIGKKADAHAVASPSPGPAATRSAEPEDDRDADLRTFYLNSPGDGFGWVRKGPTKDSAGVATLVSGTEVHCRAAVPDPDPATGRSWHYCPDNGGYISAKLLKPASAR